MLNTGFILVASFGYMGLLFAIAYYADRRADAGRSLISNPYIYALSLAVYCTAWTYYGSVGRAARNGPAFLPIYLGPTLMMALGALVLRKIIRISRTHRITSIADFIASRYGKSTLLGGAVTVIAVLGIIPYISLQLKAISVSYLLLNQFPDVTMAVHFTEVPVLRDTSFYVALILAVFAILFGTRHLDATERHEGLVAAVAFESIVKLVAFLALGFWVTYGLYDGMGDILARVRRSPELSGLLTLSVEPGAYAAWGIGIFLSMIAVFFLPRQFQVAVVENVNESHVDRAVWMFPLYLLAINIFVLPVALGGLLRFPGGGVDTDTFVLSLPMAAGQEGLALFVYLGGMSAATGMVIIETVALSTMICNDLVMPVMLRFPVFNLARRRDVSQLLMLIRRAGIIFVLLLGYTYFRFIGEFYELVSIGLVSFAAVAQFAPAILGGIFWKGGNRAGALAGMAVGFCVWAYTLVFPSMIQAGLLPEHLLRDGPLGISLLRPYSLFGLSDFDPISHSVFWSLLANIAAYIGVSLFVRPGAIEHSQAVLFVDVFRYPGDESPIWRGTAMVPDLRSLLGRFLGRDRTDAALSRYARRHGIDWAREPAAAPGLVDYAEKLLAGAIGSASARVMVASVFKEEPLDVEDVMRILDETRQAIAYSQELERTTAELKAANERLKELDRLKDEFVSTVTHELRTPLTSIRALAEIIRDNPSMDPDQREQFSGIIINETDRLTRLITQVLDLQKIESGALDWQMGPTDLINVINDAVDATRQLIREKDIDLSLDLPDSVPEIHGDRDRLIQVMVNLISNAVKFCPEGTGRIDIHLKPSADRLTVSVIDNGIGIDPAHQAMIFEKFQQIRDPGRGRPGGSGLGLSITRRIINFHGGRVWVDSAPGKGSTFSFEVPVAR